MNQIHNLKQISGIVAKKTGYTPDFCNQMIIMIFRTVAEGLRNQGSVKVKGLGEFIVTENHEVAFAPEDSVAEKLNQPFSMFEVTELEASVTDEMLADAEPVPAVPSVEPAEQTSDTAAEPAAETVESLAETTLYISNDDSEVVFEPVDEEVETVAETTDTAETEATVEPVVESEPVVVPVLESDPEPIIEPTPVAVPDEKAEEEKANKAEDDNRHGLVPPVFSYEPAQDPEKPDYRRQHTVVRVVEPSGFSWPTFLLGGAVGLIIGALAVYFLPPLLNSDDEAPEEELVEEFNVDAIAEAIAILPDTIQNAADETADAAGEVIEPIEENADATEAAVEKDAATETAKPAPAAPAKPKVVYDTITRKTNTLAALARKHYGDATKFNIIFEANKDKLSSPDRVALGMVLVIPNIDK